MEKGFLCVRHFFLHLFQPFLHKSLLNDALYMLCRQQRVCLKSYMVNYVSGEIGVMGRCIMLGLEEKTTREQMFPFSSVVHNFFTLVDLKLG